MNLISDEQQIAQMEREEDARRMEEACGLFLTAEREHQRLSARHDVVCDLKINLLWWESLERVYEREKVVWRLFVGSQPSPEQNKLYAQFRSMLLKGSSLKERLISLRRQRSGINVYSATEGTYGS